MTTPGHLTKYDHSRELSDSANRPATPRTANQVNKKPGWRESCTFVVSGNW